MTEARTFTRLQKEQAQRDRAVDLLNRLLSHKSDSLFRMLLEASPHVDEQHRGSLELVERIAEEHESQAKAITHVILELDGVPNPLGHDIGVADLNYLSIRYLLGPLEEYQEHVLEELREDRPDFDHFPDVARVVDEIIEVDERHLDKIRKYRQ